MSQPSVELVIRITLAGLIIVTSVLTTRPITFSHGKTHKQSSPAVSLVPLKTIPIGKWVRSIAFSPDGSLLAAGTGRSGTGNVLILNVATGQIVTTLGSGESETGEIGYVGFSTHGRVLVAKSWGRLSLWDVQSQRERRFWQSDGTWTDGLATTGKSAAISPDGRFVAAVESTAEGKRVRVFETESGRQVSLLMRGKSALAGIASPIAFVPDGKRFATGSDEGIEFLDVSSWRRAALLSRISLPGIDFSSDSTLMALAGTSGIEIWNTIRNVKITSFGDPNWGDIGPRAVSLSSDHKLIAAVIFEGGSRDWGTGGSAGIYVDIWDVLNRKLVLRKKAPAGFSIEAMEFSPDGKNIAWGGAYFDGPRNGKGEVKIWSVRTP